MRMRPAGVFRACLAIALGHGTAFAASSVDTVRRETIDLAPGVFVIRHADAPDKFPQGNTTVVIGGDAVLVVDAGYLPSSAREDIAEIRRRTDKPVRWLVNTHWHYDHTMGTGTYAEAFPGLSIVAHRETARRVADYNPAWFARFPERARRLQAIVDAGRNTDGSVLSDYARTEYVEAIAGVAEVAKEFAAIDDAPPAVAFDQRFDIDLGGRRVQLRWLGRGNTAGDAVVVLPDEGIVATGDLVVHPVPYLGGGFPFDFVDTLKSLRALDAKVWVPGHGGVLRDDAHLSRTIQLLEAITRAVDVEVAKLGNGSRNLDAVKAAVLANVDVARYRKEFAGDDQGAQEMFDGFSLDGAITAAYAQAWPR